jgi:hypothetical protein
MKCRESMIAVALGALCACQYPTHLPPLDIGLLDVRLVGSEPVRGATIEVWRLDERGEAIAPAVAGCEPGTGCETEDGRYVMEVGDLVPPYLVTARAGTTGEFWATGAFELRDEVHLQAVVTRWIRRQTGTVVVSPLTTLARGLADRRFELDMEPTYVDAVNHAHEVIGAHFGIDPIRTVPASRMDASMTEDVRHALALIGLSSIMAEFAERSSLSTQSMNIIALTDALIRDIQGPGATFDGIGPMGPVELDSCRPEPCLLTADTLRHELARQLLSRYLRSPWNDTGLDYGDVGEWLGYVTGNADPALFPGPSMGTLDDGSPVILIRPSFVADERLDSITFDGNSAPIHEHSTVASDLAQGFDGADCPVVYKHVNTMWDPTDNPIHVRFAALDDVVGISKEGIRVAVRAESASESFAVPAMATAWVTGGMEYEVTITRADVPRLADTEGRFLIEVQATDWLGHESVVMQGCWEHRPLSAQPWVSQGRVATGPDSLHSVGLEPVNNLAPLLNGTDPGKGVMEFDVRNGTDDAIYVSLSYSQPVASYSKSWIETNAELFTSTTPDDTCLLEPVTCPTEPPPGTIQSPGIDGPITELINGIRVWDVTTGIPVDVSPCEGCDSDEYRLEPRRGPGEPRTYRATLFVAELAELRLDPSARYDDVLIHPIREPTEITGTLLGVIRQCDAWDMTRCLIHTAFTRYQALTEAFITAGQFVLTGQLRPAVGVPRFIPRAQQNTFGEPVRLESFVWSTSETDLPSASLLH